jgi:hypothetical protein
LNTTTATRAQENHAHASNSTQAMTAQQESSAQAAQRHQEETQAAKLERDCTPHPPSFYFISPNA